MIILDFGSGETCKNDKSIIKRMIDELRTFDTGRKPIIIKWQLFGKNVPLKPLKISMFKYAYNYAKESGYETTASVFDKKSVKELLKYKIPFIKIACDVEDISYRNKLDELIPYIYKKRNKNITYIYQSFQKKIDFDFSKHEMNHYFLCCIPKYPAILGDYEYNFNKELLNVGISDHTIGLDLYNKYRPQIWEKHYKLEDSTGPDAASFAVTARELAKARII